MDIFGFGDPKEPFRLSKFITDVAQSVVCWFGDNFSWETIKSKIDLGFDIVKSIKDKVSCIITGVKDYVFEFVDNVIKGISEFFQKIVDFDVIATIRKLAADSSIPGAEEAVNFLLGEKSTGQEQTLDAAKEIGAYDKSLIPGFDSDIDKKVLEEGIKSGRIQKAMLQAIIDDKDLSEDDTAYMKKLLDEATTKGSLFVHDIKAIEKMDEVVKRLTTDTCLLSGYEEWDEGKDKKWILKFMVCDSEYEFVPDLN